VAAGQARGSGFRIRLTIDKIPCDPVYSGSAIILERDAIYFYIDTYCGCYCGSYEILHWTDL